MLVFKKQLHVSLIFVLSFSLLYSSCEETPLTKKKKERAEEYVPLNYKRVKGLTLNDSQTSKVINEADAVEQLDAIARCDCGEKTKLKYFRTFNTTHGSLPQILVPTIREKIRTDSKLQTLAALPAGLGNLLKGIFASDDKITETISEEIAEQLKKNTPGGTSLGKNPPIRLDGFVPLTQGSVPPNAFNLNEQVVRWALVFSTPNLFEGKSGVGGGDHGPQTLEMMRALMEWNYMFGLDPRPPQPGQNPGMYGGLSIDVANVNQVAGPFDPRITPDAKRFFSGIYSLNALTAASAVDLAILAREEWQVRQPSTIHLRDQARLWSAAAFAFARLRPENRSSISGMFGQKGVALFPTNAHELPLAFLPTLQALLEGGFIDKNERAIYSSARVGGQQSPVRATVGEISYLLDAMLNWTIQLRNIDQAQVNPASIEKLRATPGKFVPALQLSSNRVLSDNFFVDQEQFGVTIRTLNTADPLSLVDGARALYALARTEQEVLHSPFIRDHTIGGLHWFAATILYQYVSGQKDTPIAGAIWSLRALKQCKNYDQNALQAPWLDSIIARLESMISTWDQSN